MARFIHYFSRSTVKTLEILLGFSIVVMIGIAFSLWHMSRQPFDLMFAESYIERALSTDQYTIEFNDVDLRWPEMKGPLRLGIHGMTVTDKDGSEAVSVQQVEIGVSSVALMAGMIRPVSLYVTNPTFRLVRSDDGRVTFLAQGEAVHKDDARPLGEQIRSALDFVADPSGDNFLGRFRSLNIAGAQLVLEDAESGEEIQISELNARFRRTRSDVGVVADMIIHDGVSEGIGGISVTMDYDRETGEVVADTVFRNLGPAVLTKLFGDNEMIERQAGTVDGRVALVLDGARRLRDFSGEITVRDAEMFWPQEYDAPLRMGALSLTLGYDPAARAINSNQFTMNVQGVEATGALSVSVSDSVYLATVELSVAEMAQETLEGFFPKSELDGELAQWLVHRMDGGVFRNVKARAPIRIVRGEGGAWDVLFDEADLHIAFEAEGVNLTYHDTLKPALDIKGHGYFDGKKLVVNGESGRIEDVEARDVTVTVDDVAVKAGGYATILVHAKGPVSTLLDYIADEPIGMGGDIPFKPEDVKGMADVTVTVGLPTLADLPKEEVKVKVEGTLSELYLPDVVRGLALSGGPLALDTMEGGFTLKGEAKLDGQPVTLDMVQYFSSEGREYLTKVDAKITSTPDLRAKFGVDLSDFISGDALLDVAYVDNGKGRESVAVTGDLTPTHIHIAPFGYKKASGVAGALSLNATMENGRLTRVSDLDITAPDLSIKKAGLTFRPSKTGVDLSGGALPDVKIGATRGKADFTIGTDNVLKIDANAPVFDARPFIETSGRRKQGVGTGERTQSMAITLSADRVIAAHEQEARALKLFTALDADGDITHIDIQARVGESDAVVAFKPDDHVGQRVFHLETGDAGALLAASGLYENVRGGKLFVFGAPRADGSTGGNLYGTAHLEEFNVVRAPALAKLFGLMSLGGLNDLLGQQGIAFSKLESDFEWRFQPQGNLLLVSNGRTSGSSVGLTFDGTLDRGTDTTDIRGTIIPMTEINNVLKNIPLIGDLLTGGTGLIAATYTMKGPSGDPAVMVNPLSVLAPGFLRTILFEGGFAKQAPERAAAKD